MIYFMYFIKKLLNIGQMGIILVFMEHQWCCRELFCN